MSTQIINIPVQASAYGNTLAQHPAGHVPGMPSFPRKGLGRDIAFILSFLGLTLTEQVRRNLPPAMKRALDVAVSSLALLLLSPLFLVVAIAIKISDPGPVFFWQDRVGLFGCTFAFPKFRSMVVDAEALKQRLLRHNQHADGVTFKMKDDPRITSIGRIIRRFSIDELPQFWSVLRGDMSVVGPRPAVPREVALYSVRDRVRLQAKPGLTCIWQVSGRADLAFVKQVQLDEEYILRRSFWFDLRLIFQTIPAVLHGKGAY